ncbi:amidase [Candidatus Nanopelagicus limnes]|uniref:Amidase n=1 Tax=Candidatus Nanopelagicus limnae TaxID=1884634 RepID=A0A249JZD3_9ACTN|nr:amidase [Candidatus Nanopelagicus limnes]ASY09887.1 amidase [Candidatus Nanopelagicus limnes]
MQNEITDFSEMNKLILEKKLKVKELAEMSLERIDLVDKNIKSFIHLDKELLFRQASKMDDEVSVGRFRKNLGLTISVKDNIYVDGLGIAMGTDLWKVEKSGFDARVVSNLRASGALIIGKTKTAEFAIHKPPDTKNPIDKTASPGTSSTGSAASVSADLVMASIGTQSAASIIKPASYCNVIGFKPSYGLIPRTGILKTADTLDTVGFFANDLDILSKVFTSSLVSGIDHPFNNIVERNTGEDKTVRIAPLHNSNLCSPRVQEDFISNCQKLFKYSSFIQIDLNLNELIEQARLTHRALYYGNVSYFLAQDLAISIGELSEELREVIEFGNGVTSSELEEARNQQVYFASILDRYFEQTDFIITPSTFDVPPDYGISDQINDSSFFWTLCGNPAISLPTTISLDGQRFVGLQIIARKYNDYGLIHFARNLQMKWGI